MTIVTFVINLYAYGLAAFEQDAQNMGVRNHSEIGTANIGETYARNTDSL